MSRDYLYDEYLTRSDIAKILKIDPRTAGRLMDCLPTLRIGKSHRRVLRSDLEAWSLRERERSVGPKERLPPQTKRLFCNPNGSLVLAAKRASKIRSETTDET
jgi:hypothetical protein